ncbi:MAG: class I SAM-dependent methyltransferase [Kofleriaceae bacterium]|nr:class I SAM-dependent methyltransferase [Kofleriaceae bacterium]MCB9572273.1 class I SAM-dependent methyltransferase [Kofleriaceae bacterium]
MFSSADAYERFMGRWSRRLAPALIDLADVGAGAEVLDVGAGTGVLAFAVREAIATARVTGVDPSADYVAHAAGASADPRVAFEVGDARQLRFATASFDRALSLLAINFVPEPAAAVAEMARVTRPGGVVAAAVWDYGGGMEMLRVFWDHAVAEAPALASRDEAHLPLCRQGELGALWRAAGLVDVVEAPLTIELGFASFDDYWAPFLLGQGPAGAHVAALPAARQAALADRLRRHLLGDGPDRPFELGGRAWAVRGTVAPSSR